MKTTVYNIPVYRELSDFFARCASVPMAVFLDSALENQYGRYSIIGLSPYRIVAEEDGHCFLWTDSKHTTVPERFDAKDDRFRLLSHSFEEELNRYLCEHSEENPTDLPLISGAIGYLSYDYGRKFEHIPTRHPKKLQMPDAMFVFYDLLLIQDKQKKAVYLAAQGKTETPADAFLRISSALSDCPRNLPARRHHARAKADANFSKQEYMQTIQRLIDYIVEGDVYITNLTQQLCVKSTKKPCKKQKRC